MRLKVYFNSLGEDEITWRENCIQVRSRRHEIRDECRIHMLHYSYDLTSKGYRMTPKPSATLPGTVEKIIKPPHPNAPEKAQIAVEGADHLYKELRIENNLTDENGNEVHLKQGAKVDVTVAAEPEAVVKP
jgi:hypothetical protein